jgi:hypothetical protein
MIVLFNVCHILLLLLCCEINIGRKGKIGARIDTRAFAKFVLCLSFFRVNDCNSILYVAIW